jgi:hypothetical protein
MCALTKPKNIERAYGRSLRPNVSDLWRQRILHPAPASPPTTRRDAYLRLYNVDVQRQNLYRPALYVRLLPTFASIPLLRLLCQGSALPTHFTTALNAPPTPSVTYST